MSAATGLTAEECAAAINFDRDRPAYYQTQGVNQDTIRRGLLYLGFRGAIRDTHPTTIRRFAQERSSALWAKPVIFWTRDHYITLREVYLADSENPEGMIWRDYPNLRRKIQGYITVERDRSTTEGLKGWCSSEHGHYARRKKSLDARRLMTQLAKRLGAEISDLGDELELTAPNGKLFDDCHFRSMPYGRGEKREAMLAVVEDLEYIDRAGWSDCDDLECGNCTR